MIDMNVVKYMKSVIQGKQMRGYYNRSPKFKTYVDRYCQTHKLSAEEALSHALVQEVAKSYKKADAEEAARIPAGTSTYAPMGECV